jgi:hypothetical protein
MSWSIGASQANGWSIGASQGPTPIALTPDPAATTLAAVDPQLDRALDPGAADVRLTASASQLDRAVDPDPAALRANAVDPVLDGPVAEIVLAMASPVWTAFPAPPQFSISTTEVPFLLKPQTVTAQAEPLPVGITIQLVPDPAVATVSSDPDTWRIEVARDFPMDPAATTTGLADPVLDGTLILLPDPGEAVADQGAVEVARIFTPDPAATTLAAPDILLPRILEPGLAATRTKQPNVTINIGVLGIDLEPEPAELVLGSPATLVHRILGPDAAPALLTSPATLLDRALAPDPAVLTTGQGDTLVPRILGPEPATTAAEAPDTGVEIDVPAGEVNPDPAELVLGSPATTTDTPATYRMGASGLALTAPDVALGFTLEPGPALTTVAQGALEVAREFPMEPAATTAEAPDTGVEVEQAFSLSMGPATTTLAAPAVGTAGAAITPDPAVVNPTPRAPLLIIPGQRLVEHLGALTATVSSTRAIAPTMSVELPLTAELLATGPITPTMTAELAIAQTLENPR